MYIYNDQSLCVTKNVFEDQNDQKWKLMAST
jgi:hypothetical protein